MVAALRDERDPAILEPMNPREPRRASRLTLSVRRRAGEARVFSDETRFRPAGRWTCPLTTYMAELA